MSENQVEKVFKKIQSLKCLIIGDVMVDAYLWGTVNRISPEAPVPVFEVSKRENRLGGAANVALNIQSLGATPILCGAIGNDVKGAVFQELMIGQKLSTEALLIDEKRVTTCKTRIMSASHHMLRVDEEELATVSSSIQDLLLEKINVQIQKGIDVIVLEDYDKGLLSPKLIEKIVELANASNIPTCVDPKKNNFSAYNGVSLFKPNFKEFTEGLKQDLKKDDFKGIGKLADQFMEEHQITSMLITLSEFGMLLKTKTASIHIKALLRNIADVSGAGDTVISTAALALAVGVSNQELIQLANLSGGIVCEEVGVVPIEKDKLKKEFIRLYC